MSTHGNDGSQRRPLGDTGVGVHPLGFGCYRVAEGSEEHEAALRAYLDAGGNLIDTSANYGGGLSEQLVGRVLRDCAREDVVVITKGGYIQGQNMELAKERNFPEIVRYAPHVWHSIHPEFLQSQVDLSLERLGLDRVDVYLLHNAEYFLEDAAHDHELGIADHDEFYRRIREAFRFLETQVEAGRISWYGISSNNFGFPPFTEDAVTTMTSVARCLAEAETVSSAHHFRVVQLPVNLFESGGALEKNNEGRTVLEYCHDRNFGVLANRPLNAIVGGRLVRLADHCATQGAAASPEPIRERLKAAGYPTEGPTLSQAALHVLLGLEGLTCTLVGMRRPAYVRDALGALAQAPVDGREILQRFAGAL